MGDSGTIRIYGLVPDSIVDGPGLRYSVFVQGCTHNCPGCHNPESQPADAGQLHSIDEVYNDIRSNKLVRSVTFSGGEPFEQPEACAALAKRLKSENYNIWAYSGYLFDDLLNMAEANSSIRDFLEAVDVLVDGPFVESLKSYELKWRGSSNQRTIDVPKSLEAGSVVEWTQNTFVPEKPASW